MHIRTMTMADYARVYALWLSCKGMGLNSVDDSEVGIQRFLARNPDTCFVAEEGEEIVGVMLTGTDGRRGYIYHTAVAPTHRHKGIATQLVNVTLEALSQMGIAKAALVVFEQNESGNAFWEEQGFSVRTDLVYRNKALIDMVRMDT